MIVEDEGSSLLFRLGQYLSVYLATLTSFVPILDIKLRII